MVPARLGRLRDRRRWQERGAAALVLALVTCFIAIPMGALVVDIGMQRVARRDAQAVADTAALDAARSLTSSATDSTVTTAAISSANRDSGDIGTGRTVTAKLGYIVPTATWVSDPSLGCDGSYSNSYFSTTVPSGSNPNAVLVVVKNSVNYGLARAMGFNSGDVCRSSVAKATSSACFDLGSFAAAINTGDSTLLSPLGKLLGLSSNLSLVSYQGLAGVDLSLQSIAASSHIGTPTALLSPSGVKVGDLIDAATDALNGGQNPNTASQTSAALSALHLLRLAMASQLDTTVNVANAIGVSAGDASALATSINLLDLLASSIAISNGTHFLDTGVSLGVLKVGVQAIEGQKRKCGSPTESDATAWINQSQVSVCLAVSLGTGTCQTSAPLTVAHVLGLTASAAIDVSGGLGNASARLDDVTPLHCGSGTNTDPDTYGVDVKPGLLGIQASLGVTIDGSIDLGVAKLAFNDVALTVPLSTATTGSTVTAGVKVPQNASNNLPPASAGTAVSTGASLGLLPTSVDAGELSIAKGSIQLTVGVWPTAVTGTVDLTDSTLLDFLANTLLQPTLSSLNTALSKLNSALTPLAKLLGLDVPGADVYSVARPNCGANPALVG